LRYSDDDDGSSKNDWEPSSDDVSKEASGVTITGAHQAVTRTPDEDAPPEASLDDWSFVRGTSPDPDLPHWTEAPTGQVPAVLARDDATPASDDPWSSVPSPSWRQDETDWTAHEEDFQPAMLGDEGGAAPVHTDDARRPWEFEEERDRTDDTVVGADAIAVGVATEAVAQPATRVRGGHARTRRSTSTDGPLTGRAARPEQARNMSLAIITGVVLGLFVFAVLDLSTLLSAVLAVVVVTMAAGEAYGAMRTSGHRPAAALGLVACMALMIATYNKGITALPLVAALCFFFTFLWFLAGVEHADSIDGVATTMLVFVWVGVLGSFAGLLLAPSLFPNKHGVHFLLGAIILTVANDVGALFVGKLLGSHPLSRTVSPNKTWEGAVGGAVITVIAAFIVSVFSGWTLSAALTLGVVVAVVAPLGDLCESMFKRSLGVKDMGKMLPGHGGILDRVDGLLFVLPATYYVVLAFHLS
jgi:phosphatidate cytidylyltransferase